MEAKFDPAMATQARIWVEEVIGEKFPYNDIERSLKDGIILCK